MKKVTNWDKLKLLFWKNWILQWSRKIQLFMAVFLPIIFALLMVLLRSLVRPEQMPETHYPPVSINDLKLYQKSILKGNRIMHDNGTLNIPKMMLIYAPKNQIYEAIIARTTFKLRLIGFKGYPNRQELEKELMAHNYFSGVQFPDSNAGITTFPRSFTYALRFPSELRTAQGPMILNWQTHRLYPIYDFSGPRNHNASDGGVPLGYIMEGFLPLQHALSTSYLELASGREYSMPGIQIQRYPYPKYIYDPLLSGLLEVLPLMILLCFVYPSTFIAKFVTNEKEKQLKEVMKIMGLNNWLHWTAWFVKSFIILATVACVLTFLLKFHFYNEIAIFTYTDWTILLFFLIVYICASICFCFMLAVFFSKASTASCVTGIMWFLSYVPYSMAFFYYDRLSLSTKLLSSLLSNTALGFGFRVLMAFEGTGEGMQWKNIATPVSSDDSLTLLYVILMLILASFLYMVICLYVEQIYPGNYGVPKRWYFPFQSQFWSTKIKQKQAIQVNGKAGVSGDEKQTPSDEYSERRVVGLSIRNLEKSYGNRFAVKDLSLDMYVNEITVLLGHNGAGKTTTIFMLTGIVPPTRGTAIINGYDIRVDLSRSRQSLGICPQHNVLFEDMSVKNHIIFFSLLKGVRGKAALNQEVKKYMRIMNLDSKQYIAASKLSGGMKRKLSLCCALCGNTRTVLCDEPSSGVDTAARRRLWDLLQSEKQGRTILLTTHYMDEADVLGDRIAILCDGRLQCYDTSFELKKRYGSGYRLTCVKREGCVAAEVTDLLSQFIPNIKPESDMGAELTYRLHTDYRHLFPEIFRTLENRSEELKISGYGVSIATLEEVFMRVGAENNQETEEQVTERRYAGGGGGSIEELIFDENTQTQKRSMRILQKWRAMIYKKALVTYRSKMLFLTQFLLSVVFMVLTICNASTVYFTLEPLPIELSTYPKAVIVLEITKEVVPSSMGARIAHEYELYIKSFDESKYKFVNTNGKNFEDYILEIARTHISRVNSKYVAAATIKAGVCVAWLNNKPLHTAPLTLNILHNAMARVLIGDDAEIHVINDPIPYTNDTLIRRLNKGTRLGAEIAINLCMCMCFVTAFYIIPLVKEHNVRAKLMQFISGVNVFIYWASHFIWDFFTFVLLSLLTVVTIAVFQEPGFSTVAELSRYLLLLLVFGMAVLPVTYVLSFCFSDTATGFSRIAIFNLLVGTGLFSVHIALSAEIFNIQHIAHTLTWYFRIFPHFSLALGLHRLHLGSNIRRGCQINYIQMLPEKLRCKALPLCCDIPGYFGWKRPGILPELVYLLCTAILVMSFLIAIESKLLTKMKVALKRKLNKNGTRQAGGAIPANGYDVDVEEERERVLRLKSEERDALPLIVDHMSKHYGKYIAVHQATFCVNLKECFGLLGINGAGKTTIFKMLTGDVSITRGRAYVKGICINTDVRKVFKNIGYCPQFDTILEELTGRETIRIYCLLRGIRTAYIRRLTHALALSFGLLKHIDKKVQHYSGGNKRKLCTALALIGNPVVMYLDEPTSGMDPAARRQLWNVVCRIRDMGKSIVLTSHSMAECEALCTRLVIMVNGVFKCMGSTQHIKNKFSKGLILKIKVLKTRRLGIKMGEDNKINEVQEESRITVSEEDLTYGSVNGKQQLEESVTTEKENKEAEVVPTMSSIESARIKDTEQGKSSSQVTAITSNKQNAASSLEDSKVNFLSEVSDVHSKEFEMHFELGSSHHIFKIKQFMDTKLPSSQLQEEYEGVLTYYIPIGSIKWSELFGLIEDNRNELNIEDYTICQTTLEEVFLEFARESR